MLCERCGEREANVRITRIINGEQQTIWLCQQCAMEDKELNLNLLSADGLKNFFHNLQQGKNRTGRIYTQRAKRVLSIAARMARDLGQNMIQTENLLLALFHVEDGLAGHILSALNLSREQLAEDIRHEAEGKTPQPLPEQTAMPLSPRVKRVLMLANEEAERMHINFIDTEHLLIALAAEEEGRAARWLLDNGNITADRLRQTLIQLIHQNRDGADGSIPEDEGFFPEGEGDAPADAAKNKSKTPLLDKYGRDLTALAKAGKLDPVIGRAKEIERVTQILSRRTKNNPVLIGEPGVGKTAIVEGLAQLIAEGEVPELLAGKRVVAVDISSLVAGSKYRGEFEERMKKLMEEIRSNKDVIIFIDEVHTIVGAGAAEGALDAANILKPALSRGELQCIGATTLDEYRQNIEKDTALERRFQSVIVGEPTEAQALAILMGLRDKYEAHHRVQITDDALEAAVRLSCRYISSRFLPDKAIDLIDEACSKVRLAAFTTPPVLKEQEAELALVQKEKEAAVNSQDYEKAAELRDREKTLRVEIESARKTWRETTGSTSQKVDAEAVAGILADWTGIPAARLTKTEAQKLLHLEKLLHERIIGQDEAVSSIARAVRRERAGMRDARRPAGSFLFLGPTGVGKTELARALANALFDSDDAMVRIDMSEYMEKFAVSRLIGAPPGYIGHDEAGQLTEAVRRRPYSVVLLDEIEKAHPDVFNLLLQVLEDGRLTDSTGKTVDFRNAIIIMTSNVGASTLHSRSVGFAAGEDKAEAYGKMKDRVMESLKKTFRPEFLNRIDECVVFQALTEAEMTEIASLLMGELAGRLQEQGLTLRCGKDVKQLLVQEGFDPTYGARPLKRAIQRLVEDPLSEALLAGEFPDGSTIKARVKNGRILFDRVQPKAPKASPAKKVPAKKQAAKKEEQ